MLGIHQRQDWCPFRCPVTDYSGHLVASSVWWYKCKWLGLRSGTWGQRIAKPLYGQKLYPGFESLPLRQEISPSILLPFEIPRAAAR